MRGQECAGPGMRRALHGEQEGGEGLADLAEDHYVWEFR